MDLFFHLNRLRRGELFDYLTEVVKFNEKQSRYALHTLLEAVSYLNDNRIVHRDLKPENILLDDDLTIHLPDFGFAVLLEEGSRLRDLRGTPGYMSPKMLKYAVAEKNPGYGREIDMWACGIIMCSLLAGASPFWHRKQMVMFRRIMEGTYSFARPDWDGISDPAKDLIQCLLVVDPVQRLTAVEALQHPFFPYVEGGNRYFRQTFKARDKFRVAVITVIAFCRMARLYHNHRKSLCIVAGKDPYSTKTIRRLIDDSSFAVYRHWVEKSGSQNRAMLFENYSRVNQRRIANYKATFGEVWRSPKDSNDEDEGFDVRLRRVSTSLSFENANYEDDMQCWIYNSG